MKKSFDKRKPCEDREDGQMAAKRAKRSGGGEDGQIAAKISTPSEDGEDRLSALHDDLLLVILLRLGSTHEAVRTSALASRWRNLWKSLPEVRLNPAPDGNRVRDLLLCSPDLDYLSVTTKGATPKSVTSWLPAAARCLVGTLVYRHKLSEDEEDDSEEDASGEIHLPSFGRATKIDVSLEFVRLSLSSHGIFALLSELYLSLVEFRGPCDVGSAVSTPRCPCLRTLLIQLSRGFPTLSIKSESLIQIRLFGLHTMQRLSIISKSLQELGIENCFAENPTDVIADISAPKLSFLDWVDIIAPQFVSLGGLGQVQKLRLKLFAFGQDFHSQRNDFCLSLLRRFMTIRCLQIRLIHQPVGSQYQYLLGALKVLPKVAMLHMELINSGDEFGAALFDLLRMCSVRRLILVVLTTRDFASAPLSGCTNYEHSDNWKTEEIVMQNMEDIHIVMLGHDHEVAFVQRLCHSATSLKSLRITLKKPNNEDLAKEVWEAVKASVSPQVNIQFTISDDEWTILGGRSIGGWHRRHVEAAEQESSLEDNTDDSREEA